MAEHFETSPFLRDVVSSTLQDLAVSRDRAEKRIALMKDDLEAERVKLNVTLKRIDELSDWLIANPSEKQTT